MDDNIYGIIWLTALEQDGYCSVLEHLSLISTVKHLLHAYSIAVKCSFRKDRSNPGYVQK